MTLQLKPITITMMQLRAQPGEAIRLVERHGREITITKSGKPVAKLVPHDEAWLGQHKAALQRLRKER